MTARLLGVALVVASALSSGCVTCAMALGSLEIILDLHFVDGQGRPLDGPALRGVSRAGGVWCGTGLSPSDALQCGALGDDTGWPSSFRRRVRPVDCWTHCCVPEMAVAVVASGCRPATWRHAQSKVPEAHRQMNRTSRSLQEHLSVYCDRPDREDGGL